MTGTSTTSPKTPGRKASSKRKSTPTMTEAHKSALRKGRESSRHVRAYLEALAANKPKRGRKRTKETVQAQLDEATAQIGSAIGLKKLELAQRKIDLTAELENFTENTDLPALRDAFIKHARSYAENKGISYAAWRSAGVSAEDLKAAGITRGAIEHQAAA